MMNGCFADRGKGTDDKGKGADKQKLFEGASTDTKPRQRTAEEIKAKYRKGGTVVNMRCELFEPYLL